MGFSVRDMLKAEIFGKSKLLGGESGLDNEIMGVTIIEAPDIVKFINGGEVLLTGFYAFQSCSAEEFEGYMEELSKKKVSALAMKRGREVKYIEEKIQILLRFAERQAVPVLEVPFDLSFREILKMVMERLFNEEVRRLKYFKTTHDNFAALSLSFKSGENGIEKILNVLGKLIGNPVGLFNQDMDCLASTDSGLSEFRISDRAKEYHPEFFSNYVYLRQEVHTGAEAGKEYVQYLVRLKLMYNKKMYLVINEIYNPISNMEYIAIENALTALKQELFRQHTIEELERKFQSDIMNNILNGKMHSGEELQKDMKHLGLPAEGSFRVLVLNLQSEAEKETEDLNIKMQYADMLYDAAAAEFRDIRLLNDMDKVVVLQKLKPGQRQEEYRRELKKIVAKIQKRVAARNSKLHVCVGVGKEVEGILGVPESFREAGDSLTFLDILGEDNIDGVSRIMVFSDMGVFKLLCQLDSPQMLEEYIPESLQKLCSYKRQQRQDLLLTLNTYLDHNQNLTRTAQELFIHYKTAAYRIDRIAEITGIDFDNPSEVLAVRIGLVVYKMVENLKK